MDGGVCQIAVDMMASISLWVSIFGCPCCCESIHFFLYTDNLFYSNQNYENEDLNSGAE